MRLIHKFFDRTLKVVVSGRSVRVLEVFNVQLESLYRRAKLVEQ